MDSDYDALFDACCYMGRGSLPEFTNLIRQSIGPTAYPSEVLRDLHSLGHIELLRDKIGGGEVWRVASPSIVLSGVDLAFLQGFRSKSFLDQLDQWAETNGGITLDEEQSGGPSTIFVAGVRPEEFKSIQDYIKIPYGDALSVFTAPHLSSDLTVKSREDLVSQLPEAPMPNVAQIYDPSRQIFEDTANPEVPGFYKIPGNPTNYRLRLPDGRWLSCSYPLGKHVVAAEKDLCLLAYDPETSILSCPIGAPLPSPYGMIAIKCTGKLPKRNRQSWILEYSGVPPGVASTIWRALYG